MMKLIGNLVITRRRLDACISSCSCRNIEIINQAVEIEETHLPSPVIRALPGDMIKSLLRLRTFYIFSTLRASLRFLLLF